MNEYKENTNIVFFGGGNMGRALVGGLLEGGWASGQITVIDTDPSVCEKLRKLFPLCHICPQSRPNPSSVQVIMLAVKPQVVCLACRDIATYCKSERPLVISIAAGTRIQDIQACLGDPFPVVRCMPNTPALVRAGTTGLFAGQDVSAAQRDLAQAILASVGSTLWLQQESMLDAVTAVSGSGPAYFFYLMEAMLEAAQSLGLSADQAYQLTTHTATGAAKLIKHGNQDPGELRRAVTSKGGTTEAALDVLEQGGVKKTLCAAIIRAEQKARQLSETTSIMSPDSTVSDQGK